MAGAACNGVSESLVEHAARACVKNTAMGHLLFNAIAAVCLVLSVSVMTVPVWTHWTSTLLPGGVELAAVGSGAQTHLVVTRWKAETAQWWRDRTNGRPISVTADTVT